MLYAFCDTHGVPHRKTGKLVVATSEAELPNLEKILKQAESNDVEGVEIIDAARAKRLEPELSCVAAMQSAERAWSTAIASCWR
jgi:L-2-hydroxyglutarate oxidase LhgO